MTRTVPQAPSLPWGRIGERGAALTRVTYSTGAHMTFASIVFVIAAAVIICGLVLTGRSL